MNLINNIGAMSEDSPKQLEVRTPNPVEQLKSQKNRLELQLADVNKAIEFLEKHPDFLTGLTLLSKATGRY